MIILAIVLLFLIQPTLGQVAVPARVGITGEPRKLSLPEAIEMALTSNLEIEIQKTQKDAAVQALEGARGFFDPTFRWLPSMDFRNTPTGSVLQGSGGKVRDRFITQNFSFRQKFPWTGFSFSVDFENNRQSTSNPFLSLNPLFNSRLVVGFSQPLLRNRRLDRERADVRIRSKQLDLSEADLEIKVIDVITRVEQAYWDLVATRQDVQVQKDNLDWAQEQLARNKRMIQANLLAPLELAASEAELERRRDTWYSSIDRMNEAEDSLKSLLSPSRESSLWKSEIIPIDDRMMQPPEMEDLAPAVAQALERRPEMRQVSLRLQANDIQKQLNADQIKPQVNLVAAYGNTGVGGALRTGGNPFSSSNVLLQDRVNLLSQFAGLPVLPPPASGSVPEILIGSYGTALSNVFSGRFQSIQLGLTFDLTVRNRAAEANFTQSMIAERQLNFERARIAQAIESQLRNTLQSMQTARQRIAAAEASARAAKDKLDSEIRLFQNGESTNFLVLTRQNEYSDSRRRVVVANLDFNKAVARLEQALGKTLDSHHVTLK